MIKIKQKILERFDNVLWKVIFKHLTSETQAFIKFDFNKALNEVLEEVMVEIHKMGKVNEINVLDLLSKIKNTKYIT